MCSTLFLFLSSFLGFSCIYMCPTVYSSTFGEESSRCVYAGCGALSTRRELVDKSVAIKRAVEESDLGADVTKRW